MFDTINRVINYIIDTLHDFVLFVQFKKCEKHPWRSVTFGKLAGCKLKVTLLHGCLKPATFLKVTILHGCFSRFLNCTNGTKSRNASQLSSDIWR